MQKTWEVQLYLGSSKWEKIECWTLDEARTEYRRMVWMYAGEDVRVRVVEMTVLGDDML